MRRVATSSEFFDILDKMGNGKFVTIGYVSGANLNVPKVKKVNPLTNRTKGYPDYSVFGENEEIGALVKITSYNMRYLNRTSVGQKYGEYKNAANDIRSNFGLDPIGSKESYKQGTSWSPNGPELYKGSNVDLQSHSYNPQNIYGVKPKSVVYAVNKEGHIIKALSKEQVEPYLANKREIDGVAALRKMEVEDERIKDYINKINDLKFKYINFESNSILWIAATINGEKIVYINDNLNRAVDDINIKPEDFRAIARERYQIDLNDLKEINMKNNMNKIRLTESELKTRISESIQKILSELDWRTADSAYTQAKQAAKNAAASGRNLEAQRRDNQTKLFKKYAHDAYDKQYWIDKVNQKSLDMVKNSNGFFAKPSDYKPTQGELKRMQQGADDSYNFHRGKQEYRDGKWQNKTDESKVSKTTLQERAFKNNQGYSHFAVSKKNGKIVNGWDYKQYDPSELRQFKKDYFDADLIDYGFDPKNFRILTYKYLVRNGINPDDNSNWSNTDETNAEIVG